MSPPVGEEGTTSCTPCVRYLKSALLGDDGEYSSSSSSSYLSGGRARGISPRSLLEAMGATVALTPSSSSGGGGGKGGMVDPTTRAHHRTAGAGGEEMVVTIPGRRKRGPARAEATAMATEGSSMDRVLSPEEQARSVREEVRRRAGALAGGLRDGVASASASVASAAAAAAPAPVATSAIIPPDHDDAADADADSHAHDDDRHPPLSVSVSCRPCSATGPEAGARAYVRGPRPLSVVLCSNRLRSPSDVSEVLVHELIHVYDVHVRGLDLRDCHQLAYSEVRAAREAECAVNGGGAVGLAVGGGGVGGYLNEFTRKMCIRSRAGVATCNMFPERGRGCVADVLEKAVADRAPFGAAGGTDGERVEIFESHSSTSSSSSSSSSGFGTAKAGASGGSDESVGGTIFGRSFSSTYPSAAGNPSGR